MTVKLQLLLVLSLLVNSALLKAQEHGVDSTLNQFHQAASEADAVRYFSLLADNAVFIGTDATERWDKAAFERFAKPYFDAGKGWTYQPRDRHISFSSDNKVAWFDELLDSKSYGECRGTGVLVLTPTGWKITQYHLTIPIPNTLAKQVVTLIKQGN
ncbi:nuclear transport factor 2 family protein [Aliiglaciecola sp. LCG003]|uniref:nuclear transport factor 2 family protein n=1 Tax=Aliiglaciecola sp. LCG003 TaxID=3053655 RepID=UPI0025722E74|nr:nuclear transport factor 2 family protein [Aliiglaciecola sp. LCG003]WJG10060.1 nuclear transport factor 2 family protein [Aliiglaciecola sp. LCG003]